MYHGTVRARPNFDAAKEVDNLHGAMDGAGTKDNKVIDVLTSCNNGQRQLIAEAFKNKYGKDLIDTLKSEVSGDYEDVLVHLVQPEAEYEAWLLHDAISGVGTEEGVLVEILSFRNKQQLNDIAKAYKDKYGKTLTEDIKSDVSGNFEKLLLILMKGERDLPHVVVDSFAKSDAKMLHREGEGQIGTHDKFFLEVFSTRSWDQLAAACKAYEEECFKGILGYSISRNANISGNIRKLYGKSMEDALGKEFSGDILYGLKKLVFVANFDPDCEKYCFIQPVAFSRDRAEYFADKLYNAMSGLGTEDEKLQRLIQTHCEVDMLEIKEAFRNKYGRTLGSMIREDCSGNYKNVLLALIN